jgi:hypothetical protein
MEAGIVGLPNTGKSMLFNALTAAGVETTTYMFSTTKPNVGVAEVPDPRLATITQYIPTKKIIPAALQLVDIAGLVRGASEGEGMGNQMLSAIRQVDAIVHVVRCFEDPDVQHVDETIDPLRDIETVDLELMAADGQVVANALDKARKQARTGEKQAKMRVAALEKCQAVLGELQPIRAVDLSDEEEKELRSLGLITAKPVLYVANVGEDDLAGTSPAVESMRQHAANHGGQVVAVSAKLEAELAELPEADRHEMLQSLGLTEPALAVVARATYQVLGLQSFFTAGPKENRAWTVRIGATAPEAAGAVHSDIQRGFIRAEVYSVDDLVEFESEAKIKAAGRLRVEGKQYIVQDGDICHFLFNV